MEITNYTNLLELDTNRLITTYKAKSIEQDLDVQLTIIPATTLENIDTSFLPDNDTLSQWDHPYIAKIYDSGITSYNDYYLATEYFSNGSLNDKISRNALSIQESISILEQLVTGLDYLHKQGLIHYQLSPATIQFRENGDAVITNFALAKLQHNITATMPPILLQDDLQYMCPEEAQTSQLTIRADIYKLALITYEMLSGKAVCNATTSTQALYQHAISPPPKLPEKYIALQEVLNKGLAKHPEERHASTFHFLTALKVAAQKIGKKPLNSPQKPIQKAKSTTQTSQHLKSGRPRLSVDQAVSTRGEHELAYNYDDKPKTPHWRSKKKMGIAAILLVSLIGSLYLINSTKKPEPTVSKKDKEKPAKPQINTTLQDSQLTTQSNSATSTKKSLTTKISIHTLSNSNKQPIKSTFLLKLKNGDILGKAIKEVTSTSYDLFPATYQVIIKYQNTPEIIKTIIVDDKAQQIFINIETEGKTAKVKDEDIKPSQ